MLAACAPNPICMTDLEIRTCDGDGSGDAYQKTFGRFTLLICKERLRNAQFCIINKRRYIVLLIKPFFINIAVEVIFWARSLLAARPR